MNTQSGDAHVAAPINDKNTLRPPQVTEPLKTLRPFLILLAARPNQKIGPNTSPIFSQSFSGPHSRRAPA